MALAYPIVLKNGAPTFVTGVEAARQSVEAILATDKGTYFTDRTYGVENVLFGPQGLASSDRIMARDISEQLSSRLPGDYQVMGIDTQTADNGKEYTVEVKYKQTIITTTILQPIT